MKSRKTSRKSIRPHIQIATVNAYLQADCEPFYRHLANKLKLLGNPDIVCLQESPTKEALEKSELGEYYEVICVSSPILDDDCCERLVTMKSKDSKWRFKKCYTMVLKQCATDRVIQLVTVSCGAIEIRIGNLHLCGGKYDDEEYESAALSKLRSIKEEAIISLKSADVIVGDFNSLDNPFKQKNYIKYIREIGWNDDQIKTWNEAPFDKLKSFGYLRAKYTKSTSMFGGTPDAVWYRPDLVPIKIHGIDMGAKTQLASDHNGISVEFSV